MASVRIEIDDASDLIRDIANCRLPLFYDTAFRCVELILHDLEVVRAEGAIVIEFRLESNAPEIRVDIQVPKLYVRSTCTVAGGGFLIKDGTYALELNLEDGATGHLRIAESETSHIEPLAVDIDLKGFKAKLHVLPTWIERRLQRPIERAVEEALEKLICKVIPRELSKLHGSGPALQRPLGVKTRAATGSAQKMGILSNLAYSACYHLAFGLVLPVLLVAAAVPCGNRMVPSSPDGAAIAGESV